MRNKYCNCKSRKKNFCNPFKTLKANEKNKEKCWNPKIFLSFFFVKNIFYFIWNENYLKWKRQIFKEFFAVFLFFHKWIKFSFSFCVFFYGCKFSLFFGWKFVLLHEIPFDKNDESLSLNKPKSSVSHSHLRSLKRRNLKLKFSYLPIQLFKNKRVKYWNGLRSESKNQTIQKTRFFWKIKNGKNSFYNRQCLGFADAQLYLSVV